MLVCFLFFEFMMYDEGALKIPPQRPNEENIIKIPIYKFLLEYAI